MAGDHPLVLVVEACTGPTGDARAPRAPVRQAAGVAVLVVATARPELFERHRAGAAGPRRHHVPGASTEAETGRLVAGGGEAALALEDEKARRLEKWAAGNLLYVEEVCLAAH